eukprot:SAG11_NODE_943_length_6434_cov_3.493133_8_plen_88_part_00
MGASCWGSAHAGGSTSPETLQLACKCTSSRPIIPTTYQVTNEEYDLWPTAPVEELAKAVIESTRQQYLAVLRKHKALLDSWVDGPLH